MKKIGVLNQPISEIIAGMGHTDMLIIADAGLPIPQGVRRIDLALTPGVPGFLETLAVISQELEIESAVVAEEMKSISPDLYEKLKARNLELTLVSHEELKRLTESAVAVIRTGECTPYANIILKAGVIF